MLTKGLYAVRSSSSVEDGTTESHAGQFLSLVRVPAHDVPKAVDAVLKDVEHVIVQDWIESRVSGVAFSRHPTKDMPDVIVIDAVEGSNERLMSGEVGAQRAFVFDHSTLVPDEFPLPNSVVEELRIHVQKISSLLEHPADIEWAWDGHKLWILQARSITRIPEEDPLDQEEARVMRLFAMHPDMMLDRNDFAESAPRPDAKTFEMIKSLYRAEGPFHKASEELGLAYNVEDGETYLQLIFGWLYADVSKQPTRAPKGLFAGFRSVMRLSSELSKFAQDFYGDKLTDQDPEKIYAKASILAKFAQTQKHRPVSAGLWSLREGSSKKRTSWNEPKNMAELYAITREDAKVATYVEAPTVALSLPITITRREALDIRHATPEASGDLRGEGVSSGIATSEAFISSEPKAMASDVILIVPALTPAWFPFLDRRVRGIISETGSSMSHGAIQCRERNIPAIFGMRGAMKKIAHGEKILMNGKNGEVRKQQ